MTFSQPDADLYVPDGSPLPDALLRATHLVVGSHQDDVEFMGFPLIRDAFRGANPSLGAVILTNGAGSPRSGRYAHCTDEEMQEIRLNEQRRAAEIGRYAFVLQLRFSSKTLKNAGDTAPTDDLERLLDAVRPKVVMTHQLADKHDTHLATSLRVIEALRRIPRAHRPEQLLGGEIWRGLDWIPDAEKLRLDAGGADALASALMGAFDSQIAGGKRYDLATFGRWRANATYGDAYHVDALDQVSLAQDMTPLLEQDALDPETFILQTVQRFAEALRSTFRRAGHSGSATNP